MTKPTGFPRLKKSEITQEVISRTGFDSRVVVAVLKAYHDTIYQAYVHGIEVAIPNIGTLTFVDHKPRPAGIYWNGFKKERMYFPYRPGYYRPDFKPQRDFRTDMKGRTIYGEETGWTDEGVEYLRVNHPDSWQKKLKGRGNVDEE